MLRLNRLVAGAVAWWLMVGFLAGCSKTRNPVPAAAGSGPPGAASQSASVVTPPSASALSVAMSSSAPVSGPLPHVRVTNIGMHIGGGPNDSATKAPIRASVEPHFDDFRRCYALVGEAKRTGDFGLDLRIPRGGGRAEVRTPRTALGGPDFARCMVDAFARIDFRKPVGGDTVVSYSLRFVPE